MTSDAERFDRVAGSVTLDAVEGAAAFDASSVRTVTFDFGNTLVPVRAADHAEVVARTAAFVASCWREAEARAFLATWSEERDRQLVENLPAMREVDLDQRVIRVFARLRGAPQPPAEERWDDRTAASYSEPSEVAAVLRAYADAFLAVVLAPPEAGPFLDRLAAARRLAVISNWPLAELVERFLERAGWRGAFDAVVVSQAVGWIKPDRRIFDAAAGELRVAHEPATILHVGDDLGADVGGAKAVGWRAAWLRSRPEDSPLPLADATHAPPPDLVLDRLVDLEAALGARRPANGARRP